MNNVAFHANRAVNAAANGNRRASNYHANNAINSALNVQPNKLNKVLNYLTSMKNTINNINKVVRSPIKKNMRFNVSQLNKSNNSI
jgi:hypothetical protein